MLPRRRAPKVRAYGCTYPSVPYPRAVVLSHTPLKVLGVPKVIAPSRILEEVDVVRHVHEKALTQ